ncbi:MAG: Holliday junction branch migration protein RuvA [Pseudomonadota bacterium]
MIGRIAGTLLEISDQILLVDVQGVAYEVEVSAQVLLQLPQLQAPITLHTHMVVREDAQLLFGFVSRAERELFRAFIKLNGVGPKLGLALISALDPPTLVAAVRHHDVSALTRVPGVGKKTAERLLLELKSRIDSLTEAGAVPATVADVDLSAAADPAAVQRGGAAQEAEDALVALGYRLPDAQRAVMLALQETDADSQSAQDLVRRALRSFARTPNTI